MNAEDPDLWFNEAVATFGDRLAAAREAATLSREDAAERIGVRAATYESWEDDAVMPRANQIQRLAGITGVSLVWLMIGEGLGVGVPSGEVFCGSSSLDRISDDLARTRAQMEELERRVRDMQVQLE